MREVTAAGSTVEEAVQTALLKLQASREEINIEVITEPKKGFLGFGKREALIKAVMKTPEPSLEADIPLPEPSAEEPEMPPVLKKVNEKPGEEAHAYLIQVIEQMGVKASVEKIQKGRNLTFLIEGEDIALLIGKRGQTLNSLQYLAQLVANRHSSQYFHVTVDAEAYRQRREEILVQLANKLAGQALASSREVALEPMPSSERKIIHAALARNKKVVTYSAGEEPRRHIVIAPKR
ncbi:protein jag [Bacillus sp. FJAT-42376]|uniref:RNA-binding cell elongation regulator Jag/EloR n=1 Tax=Bacillus sp. FJAT-42376 TaxID=2014076 RepID=UPI000F4E9277|nr:RNA-binding cell elongation regulator Jag/EloR [Bacillus sp. FJAT-42376]AZB41134.1 protein jag [Bacillus sp. FJAT-42376]